MFVPVMLNPCTFKPGSLTQALNSPLTWEHAWTGVPSGTPDCLTDALRVKRPHLRRSASNGEHASGGKAEAKEEQEGKDSLWAGGVLRQSGISGFVCELRQWEVLGGRGNSDSRNPPAPEGSFPRGCRDVLPSVICASHPKHRGLLKFIH